MYNEPTSQIVGQDKLFLSMTSHNINVLQKRDSTGIHFC